MSLTKTEREALAILLEMRNLYCIKEYPSAVKLEDIDRVIELAKLLRDENRS